MRCPECEQDNPPGLRYCVACGGTMMTAPDAAPTDDSLLQTGTVLKSTYEVVRLIGEGGAGAVYEGRHVDLGHAVAIKVLFAQLARIQQIRQRFIDEGRIQANLRHPNIVRVSDTIDDGAVVAIVMELVEGETLHDFIQRHAEPVDVVRCVQIMLKLLAGLRAAHQREIVHRDIKPGNVLLAKSEHGIVPQLCDFGIAKVASSQSRTVTGTKMGTLHYMAPEQFQDAARVDARADIYSMGVTFFELLTRRLPFETDNDYQLMRAHIELMPPSPRGFRPGISAELSDLVLKTLEKQPADRFESCQAMSDALTALPEFENLATFASLPGMPISDDLLPPMPSSLRQRQPRATRGGLTRQPSPFERTDRVSVKRSTEAPVPESESGRKVPWFPIFLGVFAAALVATVAVWYVGEVGSPASSAAVPSPKDADDGFDRLTRSSDLDDDDSPLVAVNNGGDDEGTGRDVAGGPPGAAEWTAESCESLAEEVADIDALLDNDAEVAVSLLGRLDIGRQTCQQRLLAVSGGDPYLEAYGRTQADRIQIARYALMGQLEPEEACTNYLLADRLYARALSRLAGAVGDREMQAWAVSQLNELGRAMLHGQRRLQTRYLECQEP